MESLSDQWELATKALQEATIVFEAAQERRNAAVLRRIEIVQQGFDPFMRREVEIGE